MSKDRGESREVRDRTMNELTKQFLEGVRGGFFTSEPDSFWNDDNS